MKLLDNYEVRDLGNLELLAQQVVEGFIIGLHKSPFHGFFRRVCRTPPVQPGRKYPQHRLESIRPYG